jgi:uncharacterized protein
MTAGAGLLEIEVAYALPERSFVRRVSLPPGATVADALEAVRGQSPFDALDLNTVPVGIFGDRVERDCKLMRGDRVEIYRLLQIDPREARRRRAADTP